jgi:hypothetical protein
MLLKCLLCACPPRSPRFPFGTTSRTRSGTVCVPPSVFGDVYAASVVVSAAGGNLTAQPPVPALDFPFVAYSHRNMWVESVKPPSIDSNGGPVQILGNFLAPSNASSSLAITNTDVVVRCASGPRCCLVALVCRRCGLRWGHLSSTHLPFPPPPSPPSSPPPSPHRLFCTAFSAPPFLYRLVFPPRPVGRWHISPSSNSLYTSSAGTLDPGGRVIRTVAPAYPERLFQLALDTRATVYLVVSLNGGATFSTFR